ncbi:penicillin-binding transpeptidase domain-containing protein [Carboxylicivirga sp. N1Y90]|uniref:penicillin-binding transpeptidase domain-containing protein n=1 Tax=Carboxylicivirga fragile TaxID=3417571 RepID=UPI003D32B6C5|nr:class D beta-lactamase [Marinilabiliaceae bacterium N1Y90]
MRSFSFKMLVLVLISMAFLSAVAQEREIQIARLFKGVDGCFLITKVDNTEQYYYNKPQCLQVYSPCSTFKIANSLIALQTGVATGADFVIKWDSIRNPKEPWMAEKLPFKYWMQDHTLETAFKNSVVWYYQELARRIGETKMEELINRIAYGNNDISSGIDKFWLCGSMKVSAKEQVRFLRQFYNNKITGIEEKHIQTVKGIMLYETGDNYKLYGKTGGGRCSEEGVIGWYIGFIECEKGAYAFAMNMKAKSFAAFDNNRRIEVTKEILKELGCIKLEETLN